MDTPANAINWFEIPVDDFARAKKFYTQIFEYEMQEMDMGPVKLGMLPFEYGKDHVGGAISKADDFEPSRQGTLVYLHAGDDLSTVLGRIEKAGGKVLLGKTQITPEIGYFATFLDTEGNRVALHSPK